MSSSESLLPLGTCVQVRDGTPRPPDRFKRKLADWEGRNYDGVVVEHISASESGLPYATYSIQTQQSLGSWYKLKISFVSPEKVTPVAGAPTYHVSDAGYVVA